MDLVRVEKVDELYDRIYCETWLAKELESFFTFQVPGYQFMPQYRSGIWDGNIRIFNSRDMFLYSGLHEYLKTFCAERNYQLDWITDYSADEFSVKECDEFISTLNIPYEVRDYQKKAFIHAIRNRKSMLLSPTGSGKSFIIYLITRYYDRKTLIIVPTTSLVHQMVSDFKSYGFDPDNCHKIYSGQERKTDKQVTVTTWQSIYKLDKKWFVPYKLTIGDEAHLFKAKSLTSIINKLNRCPYRFGFTGTLDGTQTHRLVLEGLFGPVEKIITTAELIDKKVLSKFRIKCIVLSYSDDERKANVSKTYQQEMDFLVKHQGRLKFVKNLVASLEGNTLLLFQYVEKHGKVIYDELSAMLPNRPVYFVHGGIEGEERENIRALVEMNNDAVIVASYGTFSTGINIRNLHNIVFSSPSKSRIRNLQSIGRGLRLGDNKQECVLYDIADDLSWKSKRNYTLGHFVERVKIYNQEKFQNKIYTVKLNG